MTRSRLLMLIVLAGGLVSVVASGVWYTRERQRFDATAARWRSPAIRPDAVDRLLPQLGHARAKSRELAGIAGEAAAEGDWVTTDMALLDMLATADEQQQEGLLMAQLVSISIRKQALDAIEEVYAEPVAPSEKLLSVVSAIDQVKAIEQAVPAEAGFGISRWEAGLAPAWLLKDALDRLEVLEQAARDGDAGLRDFLAAETSESVWLPAVRAALQLQARAELAELALRLRAYQAEHGVYPDDLSELGDVPHNPLTGGEIAYLRIDGGFELRADGMPSQELAVWAWDVPDESDDAGLPAPVQSTP